MKHNHDKSRLEEYLQGIIAGKYTQKQVAAFTGYRREHICRLKKRYLKEGPACLVNGHKGMPNPRAVSKEERKLLASIYRKHTPEGGQGPNFTHFQRLLERKHGIKRSWGAIKRALNSEGILSPQRRGKDKRERAHRPRERRLYSGELVQIDASTHQWLLFAGDRSYYSLHGAIDDATGEITALHLDKTECLAGYLHILRQTIERKGLPMELYSDRAPMLQCKEGLAPSQWRQALARFGIRQIAAFSPQAKGKIERLWGTLQSRLPYEFISEGISTPEEANRFLAEEYIGIYNAEFSARPRAPSCWRPPLEGWEQDAAARFSRKADGSGTISFMGKKITVLARCQRKQVEVRAFTGGIACLFEGRSVPFRLLNDLGGEDSRPQALPELSRKALAAASEKEGACG